MSIMLIPLLPSQYFGLTTGCRRVSPSPLTVRVASDVGTSATKGGLHTGWAREREDGCQRGSGMSQWRCWLTKTFSSSTWRVSRFTRGEAGTGGLAECVQRSSVKGQLDVKENHKISWVTK